MIHSWLLESASRGARALALGVALLVAGPAHGQTDPYADLSIEEAAELLEIIEVADAARDAGRRAAALGGYQEFLLRVDDPYIRLEVARCLAQLGRIAAADAA